jgi:hypothetical protein
MDPSNRLVPVDVLLSRRVFESYQPDRIWIRQSEAKQIRRAAKRLLAGRIRLPWG